MYIKATRVSLISSTSLHPLLNCPQCGRESVFSAPIGAIYVIPPMKLSLHTCPNKNCLALVYICTDQQENILDMYPRSRIKFDQTDIPSNISLTLNEAITCHANKCYIAAAIMVRKTLELFCEDRGSRGKNLEERINGLEGKLLLPPDLLQDIHHIRFLGNDAAHVESKLYQNIGEAEVEAAIDFTKQILQAAYQYKNLSQKLKNLSSKQ